MTELSPQARTLLDAAAREALPTDADRARVHRLLSEKLGGLPVPQSTSPAAASAVRAGSPKVLLAGVLAAAGVAGLAIWSVGSRIEAPLPAPSAPAVAAPLPAALPPVAVPQPVAVEQAPAEPKAPAPKPRPAVRTQPAPTFAPMDLAEPAASPERSLALELRLIRTAQLAARSGRHDLALQALDEHERLYPNGSLREERVAARVAALCGLGRVEDARRETERFLAEAPQSPYASKVRSACDAQP